MKCAAYVLVALLFALCMLNCGVAYAQVDSRTTIFYMRSDLYTTFNTTGYGLDTENTASTVTVSAAEATLRCGIRVWALSNTTGETELTGGTPVAELNRTSAGTGSQSATFTMANETLSTGKTALVIRLYLYESSAWAAKAVFVSEVVLSNGLDGSTWTFTAYTNLTGSVSSVTFGSNTYKATVSGLDFDEPYALDVGLYYFVNFDFLNFFVYPFVHLIGWGPFATVILFGFGITAYARFRNFYWILLVMVMLSVGGVLNLIMGDAVWGFVALLATFALGVLYWKVFR